MELKNLQKHIYALATLEETASPVISCYLNLETGVARYRSILDERVCVMRKSLVEEARQDFEQALGQIEDFIETELFTDAKGVAVFARGGRQSLFLSLQFRVPVPTWIAVNSTPNIYHLVELKDTYHRYVIMISSEESVRILGVNLGMTTEEIWKQRPELRKRVGREWTREHYQNHRRQRTGQFIKEQIKLLEQLMAADGYTHLILAGNPRVMAQIRRVLPKHLETKLVDTVVTTNRDKISDIVAATLSIFIEQEEQESLTLIDVLQRELNTHGLAVIGPDPCLDALKRGQADALVLAKDMQDVRLKEEMVRLAEQNQCQIEIVNHSDILMEFGGVGCLLRYLTLEQYTNISLKPRRILPRGVSRI